MDATRFLSVADVLAIHSNTIEREGGIDGIRDTGLLESAVLMPQQQFSGEYLHSDLAAMAGAYLFHICQNHAFRDGNKRAATLAALVFLSVNGIERLPPPEELEATTLGVAKGEVDKEVLIERLRAWIG